MPALPEPDIDTVTIPTSRIDTCVRFVPGRDSAEPVVMIHGNISSSVMMFPILEQLPRRYRPIAVDLRGFGGSEAAPVDATRGMRDFSDDVLAALDALEIESAHLLGWSLGGAVAMQLSIDAPERLKSMTLLSPVSPYGFGGTTDTAGSLAAPDGAGSGAGMVSGAFVAALSRGDTDDGPGTPRGLLRGLYTAGDWDGDHEETYLAAMLTTVVGEGNYPGDVVPSDHWPGTAPGRRGVMNAMSPRYLNLSALADISPKMPILWIRGAQDAVISSSSAMDPAARALTHASAEYPGADSVPPQPMIDQTRAVLDAYQLAGGVYRETVLDGVGHAPHLEDLPRVMEALVPHLDGATRE